MTLDEAMKLSKPLREMYASDEKLHSLIDTAKRSRACRATPPPTLRASS